ncbi:MAG: ABC transporter ATP-binding protein/permease [Lachnospiraceae bacterium]|nr:ABC transporter ATP-binding protein/permease [Lachnospiraceae bacterium]
MKIIKKLMKLLDAKQKRSIAGLIVLMFIGAILEACSVAMIIPVVTVLFTPNAISEKWYLAWAYSVSPFTSEKAFSIAVMLSIIIAFIVKNLFLFLEQKILYRFIYTNQFRTSERMMKNYIRKNYEYYLNADTSVIQRNITSDVNNMYALIQSLMLLLSELIVFVTLIIVCVDQSPLMTACLAVLLGITLLIIKIALKPVLYKAGKDNQDFYAGLFKWINQTITGIKEVKIGGKENYFVDRYIDCGRGYVGAVQKYTLLSNTPRLIIEVVCIIGIVIYLISIYLEGTNVENVVSTIGVFGFAIMRLMPSANRINNCLNNISYFEPFFMGVSDNLQDEISDENSEVATLERPKEKLEVKNIIELKNIKYKYPKTDVYVLNDASMEIPVGAAVGIVGTTGAGKSTIVDVMLGLLKLESGEILADGQDVLNPDNYRKWLKNIGYIPQTVFMLDASIRKNVAFGIPEDEIDEDRIWEVLKEAQLDEFVRCLPDGLETGIGERGIRLSGGQRQRISIARALYEDPEVLVLDEATSALDGDTEKAIMDSVNSLHGKKTLIIIAHRLQTIEKCDSVYRIENGHAVKER